MDAPRRRRRAPAEQGQPRWRRQQAHFGYPVADGGVIWHHVRRPLSYREHRHDEVELMLVERGRATYQVDDRRHAIAAGDVIWMFPHQAHVLVRRSEDFTVWVAAFSPALQRECFPGGGPAPRPDGSLLIVRLGARPIAQLAGIGEEILAAPSAHRRAGLGFLLRAAWERCRSSDGAPSDRHPAVTEALRLLTGGSDDPDVARLAAAAGVSRRHFLRLFRSGTGVSLPDHLRRLRLERATARLAAGGSDLLAIALDAGFGSYSQFHRVFRAAYGCAPRDWQPPDST
jgi:AraC-like DNA-binding protein/mannose-6-phosphate isomerase-like protein (cupin superfamily)